MEITTKTHLSQINNLIIATNAKPETQISKAFPQIKNIFQQNVGESFLWNAKSDLGFIESQKVYIKHAYDTFVVVSKIGTNRDGSVYEVNTAINYGTLFTEQDTMEF